MRWREAAERVCACALFYFGRGCSYEDAGSKLQVSTSTAMRYVKVVAQRYFNNCHAGTRVAVERAFGILKARWRLLGMARVPLHDKHDVAKITTACTVLHNICANRGEDVGWLLAEGLAVSADKIVGYAGEKRKCGEAGDDDEGAVSSSVSKPLAAGRKTAEALCRHLWLLRSLGLQKK